MEMMKNLNFSELVAKELTKAKSNHKPQASVHEGYAVLLEEVDEFWEEVRKKISNRDPKAMLSELVQIASCAQKTAEEVVIPMLLKKQK